MGKFSNRFGLEDLVHTSKQCVFLFGQKTPEVLL